MVKKVLFVGAGAALIFALLFGSAGVGYVRTSISELRQSVHDNVPVDFQIKNARNELKKLDPEIHDMMRKIAKEELDVERLRGEVDSKQSDLDEAFTHIMVLRNHLAKSDSEGSKEFFVYAGKSYSNDQVTKDLERRFTNYKTQSETAKNLEQILQAREASLEAAKQQLAETRSKKRELEVRIENLEAQARMVEVAKTSSNLNFDDSEVSRLQEMLNDIESRIAVEKTIVNVEETGSDLIPLEETEESTNILDQVDTYFGGGSKDFASK